MSSDSYRELTASQLPALRLLMAMGWQYLTPSEALALCVTSASTRLE